MSSWIFLTFLLAGVATAAVMGPEAKKSVKVPATEFRANLDIVELASRLNAYNFLYALEETNLTDIIRGAHDITVFVPTNAAFAALPQSTRDYLRSNPKYYQDLIKYHVVQGLFSADLLAKSDEHTLTTLKENGQARFNVYNHSNIADILTFAGAPVNQKKCNYTASNGYIHFIDQVVGGFQLEMNTWQVINSSARFQKLALVIKSAISAKSSRISGLLTNTSDPHTIFAPNDEAFKKLPAGAFDRLVHNASHAEAVLLKHITYFGTYFSNGWIDGEQVPTVGWYPLISVKKPAGKHIRLNDRADILVPNNATTTGVIHEIDTLLTTEAELM